MNYWCRKFTRKILLYQPCQHSTYHCRTGYGAQISVSHVLHRLRKGFQHRKPAVYQQRFTLERHSGNNPLFTSATYNGPQYNVLHRGKVSKSRVRHQYYFTIPDDERASIDHAIFPQTPRVCWRYLFVKWLWIRKECRTQDKQNKVPRLMDDSTLSALTGRISKSSINLSILVGLFLPTLSPSFRLPDVLTALDLLLLFCPKSRNADTTPAKSWGSSAPMLCAVIWVQHMKSDHHSMPSLTRDLVLSAYSSLTKVPREERAKTSLQTTQFNGIHCVRVADKCFILETHNTK